ncbi:MAG: hypothetical protein QXT68_02955 [Halobacteria archaeon]
MAPASARRRAARIQYRLPAGERFRIVSRAKWLLKAELPGGLYVNLLRQEGGFTANCQTLSVKNGWTKIRVTMEDIKGAAEVLGRGFAIDPAVAMGPLVPAVEGDTFVVDKSLWGELGEVEGAPALKKVLGDMRVQSILLFFGTHFPHREVVPGQRWEYEDHWSLKWPFVPIIQPQATRVKVRCQFRRWIPFSGQECPEVAQEIAVEPEAERFGFYRVEGAGSGRIVFEPEFGKIARSEKRLRLDLKPRIGGGGSWRVEMETSSWHE